MIHFFVSLSLALLLLTACTPASLSSPPLLPAPAVTPTRDPAFVRLTVGEWQPYIGKNLPHDGCDAWVVQEAFALVGLKTQYGFFPWARAYEQALNGEWDGSLDWSDIPENRASFYLSADIISRQEWAFFYLNEHPFDWNTLDDLAGKTVGVTSGYVYSNLFQNIQRKGTVHFEKASSDLANFQKLLAGRIDIFPIEVNVGNALLRDHFSLLERARVTSHPRYFNEFKPYLLLSKAAPQSQQRMAQFDQGFKRLKASGRYDEIMEKCLR